MAINFPNSPSDGQEITEGNITYVYNASKSYWESTEGSSGASTTVYADMTALIAATGMSNGDQAFVTGNNNLYIYSGSGWYKVATVQNDSPSAITGVSGTYELAVDGTATTITAVSTDPEGFPLTWSYSTSGLGSIATISQSDNVFTITPSTTVSDVGTFSLTINATDGVNGVVSTTTNLTLEFIVIVTNSKYTTLLATAVDTSDNNNITDASTNNHSITVNGDAYAGTFSPYRSGGYSTFFDGSNDYLKTPSSDFHLSTGQFSVEVWIKPSDLGGNKNIFVDTNYNLWTYNTQVKWWDGSTYVGNAGIALLSVGKWTHLLVTRDSNNTLRIFADGILLQVVTNHTHDYGTSNTAFELSYSGGNKFAGEMRDARVISGSIPSDYQTSSTTTTSASAVITVPTEPLTAVSGTKLLACNQPYLAYTTASATGYFNTIGGAPETKPFSPYDYSEYSAADHGGSIVINGTSAWVQSTVTAPSTGSFAVECWVYWDEFPNTSNGNQQSIISFKGSNNYDAVWLMYKNPETEGFAVYANDSWFITQSSSPLIPKVWYHAAITYDGTNLRLFVNGSLIDTQAFSTDLTNTDLRIGNDGWWRMGLGKVSDVRYTRGSAVYTTDFTPPTAPLSSSGAELHIKGTDASIVDKSQGSNLKLLGNTTGSTTQVKFASSKSIYFDGTGDYITSSAVSLANSFTAEAWIYQPVTAGTLANADDVIGVWNNSNGQKSFILRIDGTSLVLFVSYDGTTNNISSLSGGTINTNTWHHVALTWDGSNYRLFVDGTVVQTQASSTAPYSSTEQLQIGSSKSGSAAAQDAFYQGYIQDARFTNGLARYTANFTPPTASLEG